MNTTRNIRPTELAEALQGLPEAILMSTDAALNLPQVHTLAKTLCPAKTGALRETIKIHRPSNTTAAITAGDTTVTYAKAVHDGTSRQAPNPFLEQALHSEALNIALMIAQGSVTRL